MDGKAVGHGGVYGKWSTTYSDLPRFMASIAYSNPRSSIVIDVVSHQNLMFNSVFKHIFLRLQVTTEGWQYARPVLAIHGTFLKEQ